MTRPDILSALAAISRGDDRVRTDGATVDADVDVRSWGSTVRPHSGDHGLGDAVGGGLNGCALT
uniref:hypothetical protein n=1 Tax=Rhodococcus qingshengii TaxID=334542 RepID=UPI001C4E2112|nr:hypothetical protein [Rhodococcus qingshengii]